MTVPCQQACSPWIEIADLPDSCKEGVSVPNQELARAAATDLLFLASGSRYPGFCRTVVRPCASEGRSFYATWDGMWTTRAYCDCNRENACGCYSLPSIELGVSPVGQIDFVKVDGATLDPSLYRLDEYKYLVRLPNEDGTNPGWPCCQRLDLGSDQPQTFEVGFVYGVGPPPAGVVAARTLTCELAKALSGQKCRLPSTMTTVARQGVTISRADTKVLNDGYLGIPEIDTFIRMANPGRNTMPAVVASPDVGPFVRRIDT